jgi:hypothetical protein
MLLFYDYDSVASSNLSVLFVFCLTGSIHEVYNDLCKSSQFEVD